MRSTHRYALFKTLLNLSGFNQRFFIYLKTFEVLDSHTWVRHAPRMNTTDSRIRWISDVNTFPELDSQIAMGPTFSYEYSARDAYGQNITGWGPNDPLNATWWHLVTECMWNFFFICFISHHLIFYSYGGRPFTGQSKYLSDLKLCWAYIKLMHLYRNSALFRARAQYARLRALMHVSVQ